jgi:hypothetical protein
LDNLPNVLREALGLTFSLPARLTFENTKPPSEPDCHFAGHFELTKGWNWDEEGRDIPGVVDSSIVMIM